MNSFKPSGGFPSYRIEVMNPKKIKAWSFLARHVVTHFLLKAAMQFQPLFKKLTSHKSESASKLETGLSRFLRYYRSDGIFPIDSQTRASMPSFSNCYVCRLCDTTCPQIASRMDLMAPSYLVSSFSRSLPDYAYFQASRFDCGTCRQCDEICPQNVPIRDIIGFMASRSVPLRATVKHHDA